MRVCQFRHVPKWFYPITGPAVEATYHKCYTWGRMATWVGIGHSRAAESFRAGEEAAAQALERMSHPPADLVFLFGSIRYDQETLLRGVASQIFRTPLVGCSTAGEILPEGPAHRSVVAMAIRSDTLRAATGLGAGLRDNPRQAGREAAAAAVGARLQGPHGFLMFPDGLTGNGAEAVRGAQDVLGLSFPIAGGSAADDFGFSRTYQYHGGHAYTNAVSGVLLAGPIALGIGARHGWKPLGKPRKVTRSAGNVVRELEGLSAVNLYETYFGKAASPQRSEALAAMSIVYPLGMPIPGEEEYLLRNVQRVDPAGALVYAGEVPEGAEVRLMMGSKAQALAASRRAAEQAKLAISPRKPTFALVFSSCSRSRLFGRRLGQEIRTIRQVLGEEVPFAGFYDYGEQAPMTAAGFRGRSYLHNETLVVCAVSA